MSKFATKIVEEVKGIKQYEQLVVLAADADVEKINSGSIKGVWDLYEESLELKYRGSLNGLVTIMNRDANLQSLPADKFKDVTPVGEAVKEYEIKYQDLRAYLIKIPNGKLILIGGYKNNQGKDFTRFRSIKKQYLDSLSLKKHTK